MIVLKFRIVGGAAGANTAQASNSRILFMIMIKTRNLDTDGGNHPFVFLMTYQVVSTTATASYIAFQSQGAFRGSVVESNLGGNVTYNRLAC